MYGLVTGCCAVSRSLADTGSITDEQAQAFVPTSPTPLLDPTRAEAKQATAFVTLACIPALGTITNVGMSGVVPVGNFEEVRRGSPSFMRAKRRSDFVCMCFQALSQCVEVCGQIHGVAKNALALEGET
jgi:exosome complex component MTR3